MFSIKRQTGRKWRSKIFVVVCLSVCFSTWFLLAAFSEQKEAVGQRDDTLGVRWTRDCPTYPSSTFTSAWPIEGTGYPGAASL